MILVYRGNILVVRNHLFWDINKKNIRPQKNKRLIIERVISRGDLDEFAMLNNFYSRETIKKTIVNISSFDKKTLKFISDFYNIEKKLFKCTKKLLNNQHWNS